jgi:hypothetical protein
MTPLVTVSTASSATAQPTKATKSTTKATFMAADKTELDLMGRRTNLEMEWNVRPWCQLPLKHSRFEYVCTIKRCCNKQMYR